MKAALAGWLALAIAAPSAHAGPVTWVLSYEGQSSNAFIWDKRARPLIRAQVPEALSKDLLDGLGGPPDPVQVASGRYLSASACMHRFCPDKGFFWVDARTGVGLGAHYGDGALRIGARKLGPDAIPAPAWTALRGWLAEHRLQPASVAFVSADGRSRALSPAQFSPPAQFQPPAGGPSFDCRKAATQVEQAVCRDPGLARRDLELAELVREVRGGHATLAARRELLALQRQWLRERDARCEGKADLRGCLADRYAGQIERIRNWIPGR